MLKTYLFRLFILFSSLGFIHSKANASSLDQIYLFQLNLFENAEAGDPRFVPFVRKVRQELLNLCETAAPSSKIKGIEVAKGAQLFKDDTFVECRGDKDSPIVFIEIGTSARPSTVALAWVEKKGGTLSLPRPTKASPEHTCLEDGEIFTHNPMKSDHQTIVVIQNPAADWRNTLKKWRGTKPQDIVLGVLEDDRKRISMSKSGSKTPISQRVVRPLFKRDQNGWQTIDTLPATEWVITYDGKIRGQPFTEPQKTTPTFGKVGNQFSGWFFATVTRRPLVVVANTGGSKNFNDPSKWQRLQPNKDWTGRIHKAFRSKFPEVKNCERAGQEWTQAKSLKYADSQISIERAYVSRSGQVLVEMKLNGALCDGILYDTEFATQLFYFPAKGDGVWIGKEMTLVDAGDYDGDGKSELIYFISEYNNDGYAILWDELQNFSKSTRLTWSYQ